MKTFCEYFAFTMIVLGVSVQCFSAQQNLKITYNQEQTSDNYYVQPGGVYVAPDGIFVLVSGKLKQVNVLCCDVRGVFVPYEEICSELIRCSFCGGWFEPDRIDFHNCNGFPRD